MLCCLGGRSWLGWLPPACQKPPPSSLPPASTFQDSYSQLLKPCDAPSLPGFFFPPTFCFFLKFSKCHWRCIIYVGCLFFDREKLAIPSTTFCISTTGWGVRCSCCGHTFKTFPLKWWIISSDVICPRWCSVHEAGRQAGRQAVKLDAWFILHLGSSANQCEGTTLHFSWALKVNSDLQSLVE